MHVSNLACVSVGSYSSCVVAKGCQNRTVPVVKHNSASEAGGGLFVEIIIGIRHGDNVAAGCGFDQRIVYEVRRRFSGHVSVLHDAI